jgi:hypothetical protein
MDMIFLYIERTYRPGVGFADATDFLLDKRGDLASQDVFPVLGTPDKVIGSFVGDVFGVLCIHACQYNVSSNSCEVPVEAALPLLAR